MIKLGIVGWGNIAKDYRQAIESNNHFSLEAVLDIKSEKAEEVRKTGAAFYGPNDWDQFLNGLDAVVIATPPYLHSEQTLRALRAGKDVLCEKPMAINLQQATAMIKAANETGKTLMVASHHRYNPRVHEMSLHPEQYGEILGVEVEFLENVFNYTQDDWLYDANKSGGGCVIDSGINAIDCLRNFLGELTLTEVQLGYSNSDPNTRIETTAKLEFRFGPNQRMGRMQISWVAPVEKREIRLQTAAGPKLIDFISHERSDGAMTDMTREYQEVLKDFQQVLKQRDYKEVHGLKSLQLVLQAYELANR